MGVVSDTLVASRVNASAKLSAELFGAQAQVSSFYPEDVEQRGLQSPKTLSSSVPGLHAPDYGSAMTSTIYMRGVGSRIDNPVVGLYIDDIPVLDKNLYDSEFFDIRRADFLRGPQGTLFGRNSLAGVLVLTSLGPADRQGLSASFECGSGEEAGARFSSYSGNNGFSLSFRHVGGYYMNEYGNESCDAGNSFNARHRWQKSARNGWEADNTLAVSALRQGGWPYRQWLGGSLQPISYNDLCRYTRASLLEGFKLRKEFGGLQFSSVSGIQVMLDEMILDQDFTSRPVFTLRQAQRQGAFTQEFIFRKTDPDSRWNHISGIFLAAKYNSMSAPVTMKRTGIEELILANANAGIPDELGDLFIRDEQLFIGSDFGLGMLNAAFYHESYFKTGRWKFTAGVRVDYEFESMSYDSRSELDFMVSGLMKDYYHYSDRYDGDLANGRWLLIPKLAASYTIREADRGGSLELFALLSKGSKAGGFNTQIFSDILQNRLMNGMMDKLGVHLASTSEGSTATNTTYGPESAWNAEGGARFSARHEDYVLKGSASAFAMMVDDLQMTVFPPGKSTGRMMTNAGRCRSLGAETELDASWKRLRLNFAAALTDARFTGSENAGKRIPYAPSGTLYARIAYARGRICAGVDLTGTRDIFWNEENSLRQPAYACAGADLSVKAGSFRFWCRAENILSEEYKVFYFKSMGNEFFQMGKPARIRIGISYSK